jgi:hypothetical protein
MERFTRGQAQDLNPRQRLSPYRTGCPAPLLGGGPLQTPAIFALLIFGQKRRLGFPIPGNREKTRLDHVEGT